MEIRVPNHTVKGSTVQLECHYDLDNEALYSVKWYKDGNEFYRYVPRVIPPTQVFPLPGVSVNVSSHLYLIDICIWRKLLSLFHIPES